MSNFYHKKVVFYGFRYQINKDFAFGGLLSIRKKVEFVMKDSYSQQRNEVLKALLAIFQMHMKAHAGGTLVCNVLYFT